jgi:hypothetical protein
MQVQQIIQASADVLTITRLSPGDVYKRVVDSGYGDNTAVLRFGVVQDVMNNGSDAAVTALEYVSSYGGVAAAELKVFTGSKPVAIFPATPEEVASHMTDLTTAADKALTAAEDAVTKARDTRAAVYRLAEQVGTLSAPQTTANVIDALPATEPPAEPEF